MKLIFSKIFLWLTGWKADGVLPEEAKKRMVVIAAPHTSNWDLPFCLTLLETMGITCRYTIKKDWMFFPMGILLRWLGAIPIDRSPKSKDAPRPSMVDLMADLFKEHEHLVLIIPPEGSRSLRTEWKTGFYQTAMKAGVPIGLGYLDYEKKIGGIMEAFYPTGNMEKDMAYIMSKYTSIKGKYPEKFSLDTRYHNANS